MLLMYSIMCIFIEEAFIVDRIIAVRVLVDRSQNASLNSNRYTKKMISTMGKLKLKARDLIKFH